MLKDTYCEKAFYERPLAAVCLCAVYFRAVRADFLSFLCRFDLGRGDDGYGWRQAALPQHSPVSVLALTNYSSVYAVANHMRKINRSGANKLRYRWGVGETSGHKAAPQDATWYRASPDCRQTAKTTLAATKEPLTTTRDLKSSASSTRLGSSFASRLLFLCQSTTLAIHNSVTLSLSA